MKKTIFLFLFVLQSIFTFSQKQIYIPSFIGNMDLNSGNEQWAWSRSAQSENFIVFWEAGFGNDPGTASGSYQVNIQTLLDVAEYSFAVNVDTLQFAVKGSSVTDTYKMMIFLLYSTDWAAYGSGQDNMVGVLHVNPQAANTSNVLAHEIGHCFQYITGCDDRAGGQRYGFDAANTTGNVFWEQTAQWQSFQTYPNKQFTVNDFNIYLNNHHKHIFHEDARYANYFIHDYWTYKHGINFISRIWRESRQPEDPAQAYKRLTGISQSEFNNEIWEQAARLTTWDIPTIRKYGKAYINVRPQPAMTKTNDNYWRISSDACIENYGYNSIKLNPPTDATTVSITFKGLAGENGYRSLNQNDGGWRFGFVALLENGIRYYSTLKAANVSNLNNPTETLSFECPANCTNLWLVVSGAPQSYWPHIWDDNNNNDEQWPYQVQFTNTDLLGHFTDPIHNETLTYNLYMEPASDYTPMAVGLSLGKICSAFAMTPEEIAVAIGNTINYFGVNSDGTMNPTSTANAPGHWYSKNGTTINWGNESYIYSELNIGSLIANIGQYPNRCQEGEYYTIKQALVLNEENSTATVTLIFNINIGTEPIPSQSVTLQDGWNLVSINLLPDINNVKAIFPNAIEVKTLDSYFNSLQPDWLNTLNTIEPGTGYLVNNSVTETIIISGQTIESSISLHSGLNLIGCPYSLPTTLENAFGAELSSIEKISSFQGVWLAGSSNNTINMLEPGKAYMLIK